MKFEDLETELKSILKAIRDQKETCNMTYKLICGHDNCVIMFIFPKTQETPKVSKYFDLKSYRRFVELEDVRKFDWNKKLLNFKSRKKYVRTTDNIQIYLIEYFREEG